MTILSVLSGFLSVKPDEVWLSIIPFIFLYPEIHYRFKYFPWSRYFRKEPEILADAPYRVEPGQPLPVLLLIKDAHRFPVQVLRIEILLHGQEHQTCCTFIINEFINQSEWNKIFRIELSDHFRGNTVHVDTVIYAEIKNKRVTIRNDNLTGLSHSPLIVFCAEERLVLPSGWFAGDLHYHSRYTSDQVEFGAPIGVTRIMAAAAGLRFFAVTDHSYDLDDSSDNYLKNDIQLPKWNNQLTEIDQLNQESDDFVILQGEEVTCTNADNRNVHCLVLNNRRYISGSGDSAERWFRNRSEHFIAELGLLTDPDALIVSAHPMEEVPFLQKWLIRRGNWAAADWNHLFLTGFQILNGIDNLSFRRALKQWVNLLLQGRRTFIFAGNDAHGNFNRFRQVKLPMTALHEIENYQLFGWAKTVVRMENDMLNAENIFDSLKRGSVIITTGPFVELKLITEDQQVFHIGDEAKSGRCIVSADLHSNEEMGALNTLEIFYGVIGKEEKSLHRVISFPETYRMKFEWEFLPHTSSYIRAVLETDKGHVCCTNPVWIG